MDLVSVEAIRALKYKYFRTLDLKLWDEFGDTLAHDVEGRYGTHALGEPLVLTGREAVVGFLRDNMGTGIVTTHVANHPEISVDGAEATGSWLFEDTVIATDYGVLIRGSGYYSDRYRRDPDGVWRITATGYVRIYESSQSLADTPSHRLLSNMWAPSA
ncbi:nuclear transport factor 2 family protein [Nocardia cyriacigeorgica]|uniref:nuclear transport factor 2 family protein n=1 Tax=Nocardia cyriacigeorgica TaxID=135487 RepID=UPI0018947AA2|nr:nuclear transport factor 2 family protein [Nocardia cyriacigeorgica]MBF6100827.1 nuclear transport factor 2 family protein [Nocardia cyriacigeorgica]MBF6161775.1 nuclear transport factor 2 family protein [Nocardia cyriacigeorgica]MBF6200573.1 nuclear transport factor 2 family protein [Nocardia cyriacigeorgica]MBF6514268.1 nuclear transport factor 2 family protein [Nocardia cyriacigeorgica]